MVASLFPLMQVKTWRRSKRLGLWLLVMLGCLALAGCVRRVPEIHGQVVDVRDGKPIAGAVVVRRLYKPGRFDLVDTQAPVRVDGSGFETTTDAAGRFTLPPFSRSGEITGMGWLVFKPGFVPASGCENRPSWGAGGCSGFGALMNPDPWSQVSFTGGEDDFTLDVRLFPPTTEGIPWTGSITWREWNPVTGKHDIEKHFPEDADPWGEYFRRLWVLTDTRSLPVEIFVEEAVRYQRSGVVATRGVMNAVRLVAGSGSCGCECRWELLGVSESLCLANLELGCAGETVAHWRYLYELVCGQGRR